jgi:hypothetical protein
MLNRLPDFLASRFFDRLAASERGRVYILHLLLGAEEGDEAGVFDHLVARIDIPELNELARKHRDDETRHARLFRECLARQAISAETVRQAPRVVQFIDRELGGFQKSFVADRHSVLEAYLLLQVIEERAVERYPEISRAMAPYDPVSAEVIAEVAQDEVRHVKYAKAISKRYAPDEQTLATALERFRKAEARAFVEHGRAFAARAVADDLLAVGRLERLGWKLLTALPPPAPSPHAQLA